MTLSRSRLLAGGAVIAAGILAVVLWPRRQVTDQERITQKVIQLTRAAEQKDLGAVLEQISERFRSAEGWGKPELKGVLASQLLRGNWVRVFVAGLTVTVADPHHASLAGKFVFGRSQADRLEDLARQSEVQGYAIDATLEREADGEWRFVTASHRAIQPADFLQP